MAEAFSLTVHGHLTEQDNCYEGSLDGFSIRLIPLGRRSMLSPLSIKSNPISQHLDPHASRSSHLLLDHLDGCCPVIHGLPKLFCGGDLTNREIIRRTHTPPPPDSRSHHRKHKTKHITRKNTERYRKEEKQQTFPSSLL